MKKKTKIIIFAILAATIGGYYYFYNSDDEGDDDDGSGDDEDYGDYDWSEYETEPDIADEYLETEILLNQGAIYKGEIPSQFIGDFEIVSVQGTNLQDQLKIENLGFGQYSLINPISLTTGEEYLIGATGNEFDVHIRYVNALTYAIEVTRNFTSAYLDAVIITIDEQEIVTMFDEVYYQFSESGVYPINVRIETSLPDYGTGNPNQFVIDIDFDLQVSSSSNYESGTSELEFTDFLITQAGV